METVDKPRSKGKQKAKPALATVFIFVAYATKIDTVVA
jgi:hypothetical protein